jgi:putative phosphoesterase
MSGMKIGVLSDTHINSPTPEFLQKIQTCFQDCDVIFHAGDLTDISVLQVFKEKEVYGVHGNMCRTSSRSVLPRRQVIELGGYSFGLSHGDPYRTQVEDHLIHDFPPVSCIVSGHTHTPVCHEMYDVLFMNPGSFTGTGRYGSRGTYGILIADETLSGQLFEVA